MTQGATLVLVSRQEAQDIVPEVIKLDRPSLTIGRSRHTADIILDLKPPANTISRNHACIKRSVDRKGKKQFTIHDLKSTNGIFVNNIKVTTKLLQEGDIVQFGGASGVPDGTFFTGNNHHIRYRCRLSGRGPSESRGSNPNPRPASRHNTKRRRVNGSPLAATVTPTPTPPLSRSSGQGAQASPVAASRGGQLHSPLRRLGSAASTVEAVTALRSIASSGSSGAICAGVLAPGHLVWSGARLGARGGATGTTSTFTGELGVNTRLRRLRSSGRSRSSGEGDCGAIAPDRRPTDPNPNPNPNLVRNAVGGKDSPWRPRQVAGEAEKGAETGHVGFDEGTEGAGQLNPADAGGRASQDQKKGLRGKKRRRGQGHERPLGDGEDEGEKGGERKETEGWPKVGSDIGSGGGNSGVEELLSKARCGLCQELMLEAAVLPCSHTFCMACWHGHVAKSGTCCPVCLRKFHSSEKHARRSTTLDHLLASLVHHLAGEEEQLRWNRRKGDSKTSGQDQASVSQQSTDAYKLVTPKIQTRTLEDERKTQNICSKNQNLNHNPTLERRRFATSPLVEEPKLPKLSPEVVVSKQALEQNGRLRSTGGAGLKTLESAYAGKVQKDVDEERQPTTCEGCNEVGHEVAECPHRSESEAEESSSEDSSEEDLGENGEGDESDDS